MTSWQSHSQLGYNSSKGDGATGRVGASLFTQKGFQTRSLSSDNDRQGIEGRLVGGGRGTPLTDLLQQLMHWCSVLCTGCQDALDAGCRIEASSRRSCIFMHLVRLERVLSRTQGGGCAES